MAEAFVLCLVGSVNECRRSLCSGRAIIDRAEMTRLPFSEKFWGVSEFTV